jgi:hypothetical protein
LSLRVDGVRDAAVISPHRSVQEAFAAIDAPSARMMDTGVSPDCVELIVVDADHQIVPRPSTHERQ